MADTRKLPSVTRSHRPYIFRYRTEMRTEGDGRNLAMAGAVLR